MLSRNTSKKLPKDVNSSKSVSKSNSFYNNDVMKKSDWNRFVSWSASG